MKSFLRKMFGRPAPKERRSPTERPGLGLKAGLGIADFFAALHKRKVRYVVLRWFEELPEGNPQGDIDLLVHDDDLPLLEELLAVDPEQVQCDVFTIGGAPGTTYRGMPYLPPDKAAGLLDRAVLYRNFCMVPNAEDHFLTLAYHAVYQKGPKSGLPTDQADPAQARTVKHDYVGTLERLAREAGIAVPIRLEALDDYLAGRGWRPAPEHLDVLARHNRWLERRLLSAPA